MKHSEVEVIYELDPFKSIQKLSSVFDAYTKFSISDLFYGEHSDVFNHFYFVFEVDSESALLYEYIEELKNYPGFEVTNPNSLNGYIVSANIYSILSRNIDDPIYRAVVKEYPYLQHCTKREIHTDVYAYRLLDVSNLSDMEIGVHKYTTLKFLCDRNSELSDLLVNPNFDQIFNFYFSSINNPRGIELVMTGCHAAWEMLFASQKDSSLVQALQSAYQSTHKKVSQVSFTTID